jgi:hypothetical protein
MAMGIRNQKDLEDYLRANKKIVRSDGMEWIWKESGMDERLRRITEYLSKQYEGTGPNLNLEKPDLQKIFFIWVEEKGLILTTEEEYKKWLATDPDLVLFEVDIKGIRVETVFVPGVINEHERQVPIFETKITRSNGESWSRSGSVEEAEKRHILAISTVLKEIRKK